MEIVRMPIKEITAAPYNPRKDLKPGDPEYEALKRSIEEFDLVEPLVWNKRTRRLVGGHQRLKVLQARGDAEVEVSVVDLSEEREKALNVALNRIEGAWDEEKLVTLLVELERQGTLDLTGFTQIDLNKLQADLEGAKLREKRDPKPKGTRDYVIDLIYTLADDGTCCIAVRAGFLYGIHSGARVCPAAHRVSLVAHAVHDEAWERHAIHFIDNDFKEYDHKRHLDVVAEYCPKYATVRDAFAKEQCEELGIQYYPLDQILKWAEELERYAQNVIVIPKYDCISEIPDKYILGYSIPTSYAGTAMPTEKFRGRKVHLLGGSPMAQYRYFLELEEETVSLDCNYVAKISDVGSIWSRYGGGVSMSDILFGKDEEDSRVVNPRYVAFAINIGKMGALYRRRVPESELRPDGA